MPSLFAACLAEFLGTAWLIFFGCGMVHVAVVTNDVSGLMQVGLVWGFAIAIAIFVFGAISGAHINPAVTSALAIIGKFPPRRILPYWLSQLAGAIAAAVVLQILFNPLLGKYEQQLNANRPDSASIVTALAYGEYYPNPGLLGIKEDGFSTSTETLMRQLVPTWRAAFAETVGTALLLMVVVCVTAPANGASPQAMAPLFIGLTVTILICVLAPLTQACFNPARDFGPRLVAYFAGWRSVAMPGANGWSFLWVYVAAPLVGGVIGATVGKLLVTFYEQPAAARETP